MMRAGDLGLKVLIYVMACCGGNPNYMHIYYTTAPPGKTSQSGFFEDGEFIWASQEPNPGDRFRYDSIDGLRVMLINDPSVSHTRTSIIDPPYLTHSDPNYYNGAYVIVRHIPNVTTIHPITGFDPDTNTLTHEDLGQDINVTFINNIVHGGGRGDVRTHNLYTDLTMQQH